jgi:hypothetical protein
VWCRHVMGRLLGRGTSRVCRSDESDGSDERRELIVGPGIGENVLVPCRDTEGGVRADGPQPLSSEAEHIDGVPDVAAGGL